METILIIDKKTKETQKLFNFCSKLGYKLLKIEDNFKDAMESIWLHQPDLLIIEIDINQNQDGLNVAKEAHKKYKSATLFLTTNYNEEIFQKAKDITFYGYLIKPFKEEELKASIQLSIAQAKKDRKKRFVYIGEYIFDLKRKNLYNQKEEIKLSKKLKELLFFLISNLEETKSYNQIINYIYQEETSLDNLRHLIKRARDIIGKDKIVSIKGVGYKLLT